MNGHKTMDQAMATATAALVQRHDMADVLAHLLDDCAEVLRVAAVAILVRDDEDLSLLSATSHRAADLEVLQIQETSGPCVDVVASGSSFEVSGAERLVARWGEVGEAIVAAGYDSVASFPLRWRDTVVGGLNVFGTATDAPVDPTLGQAFADVATLVLLHSSDVPDDQVSARVHEAVAARAQVEQAKGVLAYVHHLDMGTAYELLRTIAAMSGESLTEAARRIVREQHR